MLIYSALVTLYLAYLGIRGEWGGAAVVAGRRRACRPRAAARQGLVGGAIVKEPEWRGSEDAASPNFRNVVTLRSRNAAGSSVCASTRSAPPTPHAALCLKRHRLARAAGRRRVGPFGRSWLTLPARIGGHAFARMGSRRNSVPIKPHHHQDHDRSRAAATAARLLPALTTEPDQTYFKIACPNLVLGGHPKVGRFARPWPGCINAWRSPFGGKSLVEFSNNLCRSHLATGGVFAGSRIRRSACRNWVREKSKEQEPVMSKDAVRNGPRVASDKTSGFTKRDLLLGSSVIAASAVAAAGLSLSARAELKEYPPGTTFPGRMGRTTEDSDPRGRHRCAPSRVRRT